jgi:two-component system C4-dicarboxylate transport response regulator DctD
MSEPPRILIVDDEPFNVDLLEQRLEPLGYELVSAVNGEEALDRIKRDLPGIVVTDIKMPRMNGLELMRRTIEIDPELPVILVTAHGDVSMAVQAMHDGAYDFIEKPIDPARVLDQVRRAMKMRLMVLENRSLRANLTAKSGLEARILGTSSLMEGLREAIANLADTSANVLIRGETGTGKELIARCLHDFSRRRKHPFVAVNCGAMPDGILESELFGHEAGAFTGATNRRVGKFEHAHDGTLFLDEVESIPMSTQVKLLRVLEERAVERLGSNEVIPVDFRVVAATQGDLASSCEEAKFRQDLYFRLNVAAIEIPPLRDRREDIPLILEFFLQQFSALHEREHPPLSQEELQTLMAHSWPGNVRELRNVAERYVLGLSNDKLNIEALIHPSGGQSLSLAEQVESLEKCLIEQSLSDNKGNVQATVESLATPRRTLNQKMRKYGLDRKNYL